MSSIYDFEATTIDGQPRRLDAYRGQVLLVVNVASRCGFTPQYAAHRGDLIGNISRAGSRCSGFLATSSAIRSRPPRPRFKPSAR